jgi:hypothetical protein
MPRSHDKTISLTSARMQRALGRGAHAKSTLRGTVLAVLLSLSGCWRSPDGGPSPDAAQVDRAIQVEGTYSLSWTCAANCFANAPFSYKEHLRVGAADEPLSYQLTFYRTANPADEITDLALLNDSCLNAAGFWVHDSATEPYQLCPAPDVPRAMRATIAWTGRPGPLVQVEWSVLARHGHEEQP